MAQLVKYTLYLRPITHPHREGFLAAAEKEYWDLERRETFRSVPNAPGHKVLPLMWTFLYKFDTDGYLVKYKARLCVRGDLQGPTHLDTVGLRGSHVNSRYCDQSLD
jgi:hypothetical protein